jgi:hypothetical protein
METEWKRLYGPLFPKDFHWDSLLEEGEMIKLYHLLSEEEIQDILDWCSEEGFESSTMIVHQKTVLSNHRTSQTHVLTEHGNADPHPSQAVENLLRRICILTKCTYAQIEGLSVVRYQPSQHFSVHMDTFDPKALPKGGQRIGSMIIWLNDLEHDCNASNLEHEEDSPHNVSDSKSEEEETYSCGGETWFPYWNLELIPDKGCGVFWWNTFTEGQPDERYKHAALPVRKGEKWIIIVWIRDIGW